MGPGSQQSLVFLGLPDLKKLCCVTLTLQDDDDDELRSKQMKTCRELVLLFSDVLASPALDSFAEITVVMALPFFQKGILQVFGQRRRLQLGSPQSVFPGVLQCCLSYSLTTRLAPRWNKAGLYLVTGKDFLSETGRLGAVRMELSTSEAQLCISIEASTVRLPPTTLEDFNLSPLVLRKFCSDPDSVLDPSSTGGPVWCHVLPSMKKGQIVTISRKLPPDGPFRTYRDLQTHWTGLYGYRLPDLADQEVVYCSVYFRPVGDRLFTYPLSCIRLQPLQRCPQDGLQGTLGSFLSDIRDRLQRVCGLSARLSSRVLSDEPVDLASSSSSTSLSSCSSSSFSSSSTSFSSCSPSFSSSSSTSFSSCSSSSFSSSSTSFSSCSPSSSSSTSLSSCSSSSFSSSSSTSFSSSSTSFSSSSYSSTSSTRPVPIHGPPPRPLTPTIRSQPPSWAPLSQQVRAQGLLGKGSGVSSILTPSQEFLGGGDRPPPTSSSSCVPFSFVDLLGVPSLRPSSLAPLQPASSLTGTTFSSVLSPPPAPAPKLVPSFKSRQKEVGRVTLPAFRTHTPVSSSSVSSLSAASLSLPLPATPSLTRHPDIQHLPSLSPALKSRPGTDPEPQLELGFKSKTCPRPILKQRSERRGGVREEASDRSSVSSGRAGVVFQPQPRKSRRAVRDVDVEEMARSNQLWKVNSATLLAWLRGRGALVGAKHRKEELILKVMSCLAEA